MAGLGHCCYVGLDRFWTLPAIRETLHFVSRPQIAATECRSSSHRQVVGSNGAHCSTAVLFSLSMDQMDSSKTDRGLLPAACTRKPLANTHTPSHLLFNTVCRGPLEDDSDWMVVEALVGRSCSGKVELPRLAVDRVTDAGRSIDKRRRMGALFQRFLTSFSLKQTGIKT